LPCASKCSYFHLVCIANLLSCAGGPRYLAFFLRYCFRMNAAGPSVCRAVADGPSGTASSRSAPGRRSLEGPSPREGAWVPWRKMRSALAMKSPDFCLFRSGGCDHAIARLGFSAGRPSRFGLFLFLPRMCFRKGRDVGAEPYLAALHSCMTARGALVPCKLHLGHVLVVCQGSRAAGSLRSRLEDYHVQGLHIALLCFEVRRVQLHLRRHAKYKKRRSMPT
jgi:hypothetical protein